MWFEQFVLSGVLMSKFDYIIVGGGSAGCVLASRLSEDPRNRVCLLEAGGAGKSVFVRAPAGIVAMVRGKPPINNWALKTVPQKGLNGRTGFQPRGKALGGSSAINAMLYVRGHKTDYDEWAQLGCTGWSFEDVLPYFKKAERNERGTDGLHGNSGPLAVCDQREPREITNAFVRAGNELQFPTNNDFNGSDQEGMGVYQVTQFFDDEKNGQRCSAAAAYLHPVMNRPNLEVKTGAKVHKILFEGKVATGVRFEQKGTVQEVFAGNEVLLSGGAFHSPQVLMLSGVGNGQELFNLGIDVVHDLPGVGENLQDHLDTTLAYSSKSADVFGIGVMPSLKIGREFVKWLAGKGGLISSPMAEGGAFLKTDNSLNKPDIQLHFVIAVVDDHGRKLHWGNGYSCHVCQLRPYSRGNVKLGSSNPNDAPLIDPGFLSDERDLKVMIKGAKLTKDIMSAPAMKPYLKEDKLTQGIETDSQWEEFIRSRSDTIYHPVGTCKMGGDDMSVVDPSLRVKGVENIRVVDASIMPTLIGGNTNAPTIMIAEKAADMILSDRLA